MSAESDTPRTDAAETKWGDGATRSAHCHDDSHLSGDFADFARQLERELNEARAEIARLREIFPKVLEACGNGSGCTPDVSLEFLTWVPEEVSAVIRGLKRQRDREANLLDKILVMAATGTDESLRLVIRQAGAALAEVEGKEGQ